LTVFLILCGLLVAATLACLLPPLLARREQTEGAARATSAAVYRDQLAELDAELKAGRLTQEQWAAAAAEIERRVLDDGPLSQAAPQAARSRGAAILVGITVPVTAIALYLVIGSPDALSPESGAAGAQANHQVTPEQIQEMVAKLAARLESTPDDAEGWMMLARSYGAMQRFDEAVKAYQQLTRLRPNDAQVLADHADMLALAQGRTLQGEPEKLIARALAADPDHVKALALAGSAAFERRDWAGALVPWRRLLQIVPPEAPVHASIRGAIADIEKNLAQAGGTVPPAAPTPAAAPAPTAPAAPASTSAALQGRVTLPAALASARRPEDTVFVFARAANGPRMPLAVMRKTVKDLPFDFRLDDSMAMTPEMTLSKFPQVVVVVRISGTGSATAQKGDLEATSDPVAPGASGVVLGEFRIVP
jgi:cytochrome c-type biogenesis protein CcmH